jgi:predicted nucleotidyltransferase
MRKTAINVMRLISGFEPRLTGSVWRGTARKGSDIDIIVFHNYPLEIKDKISVAYEVLGMDEEIFNKSGIVCHSSHIRLEVEGYPMEIVVRPASEKKDERCEIYGDLKKGIDLNGLEKLIKSDPLRKFIPRRRS